MSFAQSDNLVENSRPDPDVSSLGHLQLLLSGHLARLVFVQEKRTRSRILILFTVLPSMSRVKILLSWTKLSIWTMISVLADLNVQSIVNRPATRHFLALLVL
jgi:hypothetical protein